MRIEVKEQFPGRVVEVMKPDAVRWVGTAVVVEVGGGLDELARHYEFTAEEALVLGLAISQVAVKGLDQRAVCQVYERAMGRVMWAAMDGAEPLNEELGMVNSELLGNVVPFVGAGAGAPASQAGMPTPLACADSLEGPE